jgi:hypothetical protein|tara:strand:+ start:459 stop:713 length:255 start_codon:yes stop_codon:yes gene_type:complete
MNVKDREQMEEFRDKLNSLDKKVQGISDALLDDERTSRIGVISEVEQMRKDMQTVMRAYKICKWIIVTVSTFVLGLLGHYTVNR